MVHLQRKFVFRLFITILGFLSTCTTCRLGLNASFHINFCIISIFPFVVTCHKLDRVGVEGIRPFLFLPIPFMTSSTWPASMQMFWNKRNHLHKKRVHLLQDWFGTPTWPPFRCFGTPIWPTWRHVKTLYCMFCFPNSGPRGTWLFVFPKIMGTYICTWIRRNLKETVP